MYRIDNVQPSITDYNIDTNTLNIEFSEELNLTDSSASILTSTDIILTNATSTNITIENSGGKGRVVAVLSLDINETQADITISGDSYSDTLGNTGASDYTLTIDIGTLVSEWLTAGECQNFPFDGGDGSTGNPYQISNICQLQNIADNTIDSLEHIDLLTQDYILISNIDGSYTENWNSGAGFEPLGDDANSFDGTFDGGGFTISNLTINVPASDNVGLFGYNTGTIKDFTLENATISGNENVGGLVGANGGTIENVSVENVAITGTNNIGGFVGEDNSGTYSGNSYCQQDSSLLAVGNSSNISGITTYGANCEILISTAGELQAINDNLSGNYRLVNDIDVSSISNFNPLGDDEQ